MSSTGRGRRREVYGTEQSWCRGVPGGTGVTVVSLLWKFPPPDLALIHSSLLSLQNQHPILRATLLTRPSPSFFIPPSSSLTLRSHDALSTAQIIRGHPTPTPTLTPFHIILEHEMNLNPWEIHTDTDTDTDNGESSVMHATSYELEQGKTWTLVIKLHTAVCDRTAAVHLLKELLHIINTNTNNPIIKQEPGEVLLGIEEYVPSVKSSKPFWSRGVDMLGYSLNSFRLSNLPFMDPASPRSSRVVRFFLHSNHTSLLLQECKTRGIKLCGALSAAALIAARLSKPLSDGEWEKYAVVTLTDCRKLLHPPLSNHHVGFYHSAILNTHDMQGGEDLWGLAKRTYESFENAKNSNKHFSDMTDLNFLMCRAIENPGLTPSSSLRTSLISVFEDSVIDETNEHYEELGIEDYMGCASVHGVGPSVAVFDTIRDGKLDCACVYPFPLHSREQMLELIENMKRILVESCSSET